MSATDVILRACKSFDLEPGALSERFPGYVIEALTAAGYRIVAPGSLDDETLERAAQVVDEQIGPNAISDEIRALKAARRALQEERG